MRNRRPKLTIVSFAAAGILVAAFAVSAQVSQEAFRKILTGPAAFTDADMAALGKGETVVRTVRGSEKREVEIFGAVRVKNLPDLTIDMFRLAMTQKNNKLTLAQGKFSTPPVLADIQPLKLDKHDFEDLRECAVGNCLIKLPAAMIKRLQAEIDWNAADAEDKVSALLEQFLVDYVYDYLARGDLALMQYDDQLKPLRLADEYKELTEGSVFLDALAPEFKKYLASFPRTELKGVDNSVFWTKLTFGLKPMVSITHSTAYDRRVDTAPMFLIATKQIYASRYIDSSLALSMFITVKGDAGAESFLVFTDVSRADALAGAFSGVKHAVVEREAVEKATDLLERAKGRLEKKPAPAGQAENDGTETMSDMAIEILKHPVMLGVGFLFFAGLILFAYGRLKK
ncbi:hypothetical protein BH10ACI3_BH10ACI3_26880 [soil metagenome]